MRADERSFRFLFFIAKETKVYICTTGTLRITNSSSDTNLDEGSVYEGVHFVHAQARDGVYTQRSQISKP